VLEAFLNDQESEDVQEVSPLESPPPGAYAYIVKSANLTRLMVVLSKELKDKSSGYKDPERRPQKDRKAAKPRGSERRKSERRRPSFWGCRQNDGEEQ
jgi:hypothetical protein